MENYNDIKQILEERQRALLDRLHRIHAHTRRANGPLDADSSEQAVELENEEVLTSLDDGTRQEILRIRAALERMDTGNYGSCITCDEKIAPGRLAILPFALHCMACAESTGKS